MRVLYEKVKGTSKLLELIPKRDTNVCTKFHEYLIAVGIFQYGPK